jgi:probable HAF family extracellular repeat protein
MIRSERSFSPFISLGRVGPRARADFRIGRTGGAVLILLAILAAHAGSAHAAEGPFIPIDLGTFGGRFSIANAINASGRVVGASQIADGRYHAFSWTAAGGMVDLGTLPGFDNSTAVAVNASGQVVGVNFNVNAAVRAFSWTAAGGMVDLGTLGGSFSAADAVNASGQVVGTSSNSFLEHAFSWTAAGGIIDLGAVGGLRSIAVDLNDNGLVVGHRTAFDELFRNPTALLWLPISSLGCKSLAGCNLKEVNLAGAYLKGGDLRDANLKDANLARANLSGANLTDANLKDANLSNANLSGANLSRANLKDANLTNANLTGARLKGTNIKDVIWSNTICPDGTNSNANGGTCAPPGRARAGRP